MKRTIRINTLLPYKPEYVWAALTDSNMLGRWFMKNDLIPEKGNEFTFRMAPQKGWDGVTYCKVIEVEPPRKITYTYKGSASGEKALVCAGINSQAGDKVVKGIFTDLDTILTFRLEPVSGGAGLSMEHSGFMGFKGIIVSYIMQMGWKKQLLRKLPALLKETSGNDMKI